ncbi:MAG: peptidoglycan binding domain-containing protein [Lachnospirales bacterium]
MKMLDFSKYNQEDKIVLAKYFSAIVVLLIVLIYSLSFAAKSKNYAANKAYDNILQGDYIYGGVYIDSVYVGGLTKEQAKDVARMEYADRKGDGYTISFKTDYGYNNTLSFKELGANYDTDKAVEEAYKVNRSGGRSKRVSEVDELRKSREFIMVDYSVDEGVLKGAIEKVVKDADKEYTLKGGKANYDRTYEMAYSNLQIQEKDIEIYIPWE